jgi:hypothetical protein
LSQFYLLALIFYFIFYCWFYWVFLADVILFRLVLIF